MTTEQQDLRAQEKAHQLEELAKGDIYPVTIVREAQSDVSGAEWLALQAYPDEFLKELLRYDLTEKFWAEHDDLKLPIGKGKTPNEALEDLKVKARKFYESW